MTLKIQIIIGAAIVFGLVYILSLIRKNRLELKYALSWFGAGIFVLILDIFPGLMESMAELIGIASPVNMIFFLGFCFSLVIILTLTVAVSIAASSVKRLTQKVAMLEKKINEKEGLE